MIVCAVTICFGAAAVILGIYSNPSDPVIIRVIGAFGAMFSGIVGLAIGYISGRGRGNGTS